MSFPVGPDAFTAANGTELHAYNAGWTQQRTDPAEVQSNAAGLRGGGSEGNYKWDGDTFTADQYAQAVIAVENNYGGVAVRMTGTTNGTVCGYICIYDSHKISIQRIDNGSRSVIVGGVST